MGKEQNENFGSGVVDVFDAIASGHEHKSAASGESTEEREQPRSTPPRTASSEKREKMPRERPKGRTGRTPGRKNGPLKEKMTGRVTPDMRDAYVEWAFDDRCSLSELIERALTEFYQRHRATSGK